MAYHQRCKLCYIMNNVCTTLSKYRKTRKQVLCAGPRMGLSPTQVVASADLGPSDEG